MTWTVDVHILNRLPEYKSFPQQYSW